MHKLITISREFGSGGRELGKRLAEALGGAYYDREIITAIAEKSGLAEQYVAHISERGVSAYYPITYGRTFSSSAAASVQMQVLAEQHKILRALVEKGDCVIVGRCADVILQAHRPLNLFVYADADSRLARCRSRQPADEPMTDRALTRKIAEIDRARARYRALLTDTRWGDKAAYHLCINTTGFAVKDLIPTVVSFTSCYFGGPPK